MSFHARYKNPMDLAIDTVVPTLGDADFDNRVVFFNIGQ